MSQSTHFNPPIENPEWDHSYTTWDPSAYGDGPLEIGYQGYVAPSCVAFIEACEAIGIPIVEDLNTGNSTGVKQGTGHLDGRLRRSSAFDSYYQQAKHRSNLDVLHDATVEKIRFETLEDGSTRATGVQFTDHLTGEFFVISVTKEVILAGGAFASPQILMVSVSLADSLQNIVLTLVRA
jgi:choline dehydrogenase